MTDFEREFPSLCFALATGVGKTRLMGAFIAYLHLAQGHPQFLRPCAQPDHLQQADRRLHARARPKYVFQGIAEFARRPPASSRATTTRADRRRQGRALRARDVHLNIFNISKINAEDAGRQAPRIRAVGVHRRKLFRLSLWSRRPGAPHGRVAPLPGHSGHGGHQRAEAHPRPRTDRHASDRARRRDQPVQERHLRLSPRQGDEDGFVKEPAVATRKNFDPATYTPKTWSGSSLRTEYASTRTRRSTSTSTPGTRSPAGQALHPRRLPEHGSCGKTERDDRVGSSSTGATPAR